MGEEGAFVGLSQTVDVLVHVAMVGDLVSVADDGFHDRRMTPGHVGRNEEGPRSRCSLRMRGIAVVNPQAAPEMAATWFTTLRSGASGPASPSTCQAMITPHVPPPPGQEKPGSIRKARSG